jgi:FkbM family methyltransferase
MDDPWSGLPPPLTGATTHADHGEDIILKVMFDVLGMPRPRYLDVGAFDPYHINNTAALYASGARGINVEANPKLMGAFAKFRPEDLNLNCAVGPERAESRRLYIDDNPGLSSFHESHILEPKGFIDVPVWTIPDILQGHCDGAWPDLLSIDIEGEDIAVIESCLPASGDRPPVVCVEYLRLTQDYSDQWRELMIPLGYYLFFRTRSNMIWVTAEALATLVG